MRLSTTVEKISGKCMLHFIFIQVLCTTTDRLGKHEEMETYLCDSISIMMAVSTN